jgi:DNA topoisomerase-2
MTTTEFYSNEYVDYGSYDNLRKIASVMDGQKNASRKVLRTVLDKNIKNDVKVNILDSRMKEYCEYLHGSAENVIVNLAQNYSGTNNIPLLAREGNFGTRLVQEASASRYIYTYGSNELFDLFKKEDQEVLTKQYFEGVEIEPLHYVPNLPILLINGSEGVSSGFAQKILPRNPSKIKQYIQDYLNGSLRPNSKNSLEPYYEGFNGDIVQGENPNQWIIKGKFDRVSSTKVKITELPIGYDLNSYIKVLDKLEETKSIVSYKDLSSKSFLFEVQFRLQDLKSLSDSALLQKLKLTKTTSENFTVIDENNKIKVFNSAKEVLDYYIDVKLKFMQKRKDNIIEKTQESINYDLSKYYFIKAIVQDELKINKRKKDDIVQDIEKIQGIIKRDGSFDYLLGMNILSLSEEKLIELHDKITKMQKELKEYQTKNIEELWMKEL